jgi:hypothetical protein
MLIIEIAAGVLLALLVLSAPPALPEGAGWLLVIGLPAWLIIQISPNSPEGFLAAIGGVLVALAVMYLIGRLMRPVNWELRREKLWARWH